MKYSVAWLKGLVAMSAVVGLLALPLAGEALEVVVQTVGNPSNAAAGESGATVDASALLSVQVTRIIKGTPVSGLGESTGDGTSEITLPPGWELRSDFNVPPGGCIMSPTEFTNAGKGLYTIRVVPFLGNSDCTWLSGDYHYQILVRRKDIAGSGLGVLSIP
jgi:hypothetical protein